MVDVQCPYEYCSAPTEAIPTKYLVKFEVQISKGKTGTFIARIHEDWAPQGTAGHHQPNVCDARLSAAIGSLHFYRLLREKYYDMCAFYRVLDWMVRVVRQPPRTRQLMHRSHA
jgi:hypothetical protein